MRWLFSTTLKLLLAIFLEDINTGEHSSKHTNHDQHFDPGNVIETSKGPESPPLEGENYLLITEHAYTQVNDKNQVRHVLNSSVFAWR